MSRLKTSFGNRSDLSVHQVVNSNDIMSEILLLLPPETVYNLIMVSKRWLQIISDPFFRQTYLTKWRTKSELLGFFVCKTKNSGSFKYELRHAPPQLLRHPSSTRTSLLGDEIESLKQLGHYVDSSSNGFVLCSSRPNGYYLWNPITRMRHRIPHPMVHFEISCTSLMIVEDRPLSYKVIRADWVSKPSAKLRVDTFSSNTNAWSYSEVTCSEAMVLILGSQGGGRGGKVIGGVVYWYATGGRVAIYDSNNKEKRIDLVKLPKIYDSDERVLARSGDGCVQYGRCTKSVMEIWKLEEVSGVFKWKHQHKLNFKVMWRWYDVKQDARFERKLLAFPIRNETHAATTITQIGSKKKSISKEEEQGVPYGVSEMYCHSFDDLGFPFFLRYTNRGDVSEIIGRKLLRHYMSSSV